jgi:hypothetical protein
MKKLNPKKLKAIYALLGDNGLRDEKESIVNGFSGGRTTHASELTNAEAAALIGHLKSLDQTEGRATKMRNKILSMAHEMNWTTSPLTPLQMERGKKKVDMQRVNNWCSKYGHAHKPLDDYSYNELPRLVSQFEEVYKSHLKAV